MAIHGEEKQKLCCMRHWRTSKYFYSLLLFLCEKNSVPGLAGLPWAGILARSSPNPCLSVCVCIYVEGAYMRSRMCSFLSATAHIYLFHASPVGAMSLLFSHVTFNFQTF